MLSVSVCTHYGVLLSGRNPARGSTASGSCGLILLLAALKTGIVRLEQVKEVGNFLTGIFPLLFVPAAVGVMELWGELGEMIIPILLAIVPVTILVLASAGRTTQSFSRRKQSSSGDQETEQEEAR